MNIIHPDIDAIIVAYCGLKISALLQVNRWFHDTVTKSDLYLEYKTGHNKSFLETCIMGLTNYAQYIVTPECDLDWAFIASCGSGQLAIAQWLIALGKGDGYSRIGIHAYCDYAFQYSCERGHITVAQWLIKLGESTGYTKIDIHANRDFAFQYSCANRHLNVAQWLIQLGDNGYGSYTDLYQKKLIAITALSC